MEVLPKIFFWPISKRFVANFGILGPILPKNEPSGNTDLSIIMICHTMSQVNQTIGMELRIVYKCGKGMSGWMILAPIQDTPSVRLPMRQHMRYCLTSTYYIKWRWFKFVKEHTVNVTIRQPL